MHLGESSNSRGGGGGESVGGGLRILFSRDSISMPREGSQESILVSVGGPVPERYLKFLEGAAETSSTQTQQSLGYV